MGASEVTQCEGWRRYGSAFSLGPVKWVQCDNDAVVTLKVKQDDGVTEQPACMECWHEAVGADGIEIISATPLPEREGKEADNE